MTVIVMRHAETAQIADQIGSWSRTVLWSRISVASKPVFAAKQCCSNVLNGSTPGHADLNSNAPCCCGLIRLSSISLLEESLVDFLSSLQSQQLQVLLANSFVN